MKYTGKYFQWLRDCKKKSEITKMPFNWNTESNFLKSEIGY